MDTTLMKIIINGSGVDSGEVDYLLRHAEMARVFHPSRPQTSRDAYRRDIHRMLDQLKEKVDAYYGETEK